jgi:hypothetical protein
MGTSLKGRFYATLMAVTASIMTKTPSSAESTLNWKASDWIRYDAELVIDADGHARSCRFLKWRAKHPDLPSWDDAEVCERLMIFLGDHQFSERSATIVYHYDNPIKIS